MSVVFYIVTALYVLTSAFVLIGLLRRWPKSVSAPLRSASVIICARDEEVDLPACLESLEKQILDPGTEPLEVILVDDVSSDRTLELMQQFAATSRQQVRILKMPPPQPGEPSGKWRPLKEGMQRASQEALLLTDADAVLPPTWAQSHLHELGTAQMAAGFARLDGHGAWGGVQSLDWLLLLGVGSAMNRLGAPQAALGKNLSVRRQEYLAAGGLEAAGFSLTEDQALVLLLRAHGGSMRFPLNHKMLVSTPAVPTWGDFVRQRQRWASGIRNMDAMGLTLIGIMGLRNFAIVIGVLTLFPQALILWGTTAAMNFLIQARLTAALKMSRRLRYFVLWEIFHTWTTPWLTVLYLVRPKVAWKGRKFMPSNPSTPV
jgi:cellulose synthase/poly-beta-1,6-N-acetylglucosamine synthase-like glycosyltransferase